jgi:nitrate reductase NapAB chaperone NapD
MRETASSIAVVQHRVQRDLDQLGHAVAEIHAVNVESTDALLLVVLNTARRAVSRPF